MKEIQDKTKKKFLEAMTPQKAGQFLLLGLFWLLFSLPLVTIGPATCAVFYIGIKILYDEKDLKLWPLFLKGFKENFKQGLIMSLISVLTYGAAGFFDYWVVAKSSRGIILIFLAAGASFVVLIFNLFLYPIIARYENSLGNDIKNAIALAFTYNKDTIRLVGLAVLEIAVIVFLAYLNLFAGLAALLFWPSVIFYTVTWFMAGIFYRVENPIKYDDEGNEIEAQEEDSEIESESEEAETEAQEEEAETESDSKSDSDSQE